MGGVRDGRGVLGGLMAGLARLRVDLGRPARNRRVLYRLQAMSDRELADVGLWRQDVRDAVAEAGDVSRFLVGRREARRTARAALRREAAARR